MFPPLKLPPDVETEARRKVTYSGSYNSELFLPNHTALTSKGWLLSTPYSKDTVSGDKEGRYTAEKEGLDEDF